MQRQEIADLLHIGPAGVHYLANRADFPAPVKVVRVGGRGARLWLRDEIEAWAAPRGYLGRGAVPAVVDAPAPPAPAGPVYAAPTRGPRHYARRA